MRRLTALLFGLVLGGALVSFSHRYHVVQAPGEWLLVPKTSNSIAATYVDIRHWTANEWRDNPDLIRALFQHGRGEIVVPAAARPASSFALPGWNPPKPQGPYRR